MNLFSATEDATYKVFFMHTKVRSHVVRKMSKIFREIRSDERLAKVQTSTSPPPIMDSAPLLPPDSAPGSGELGAILVK